MTVVLLQKGRATHYEALLDERRILEARLKQLYEDVDETSVRLAGVRNEIGTTGERWMHARIQAGKRVEKNNRWYRRWLIESDARRVARKRIAA